ncbi:MAG: alanine racemase [Clostridia bacterium]|nr:alanine racemase [Clostridia bacterium]
MENYQARAWAEIDLDAIAHNVKSIKKLVGKTTKILCVVKANAYGHGFFETAKTMIENGADALGVATFEEGRQLRLSGFLEPIVVLGSVNTTLAADMIRYDISATITDELLARAMSKAAILQNKLAKFHIKIDTGMSRLGFSATDESIKEIVKICNLPNVSTEGLFTHLSCADEKDRAMTNSQYEKFIYVANALEKENITFTYKHICNSAGVIEYPEYHLDMVRPGIIIYGLYPDACMDKVLDLIPAMTVKARITRIDEKEANTPVSYGATYKTKGKTKLATVPIGYADGYLRCLSDNAYMSVHGVIVPVVGRICMDQCMIDVSAVNNINVGDEVIVFGNGGDKSITLEELAKNAGTVPHEILSLTGNRTPRAYIKGGKIIDVLTYI